jgi:hypothetical protein
MFNKEINKYIQLPLAKANGNRITNLVEWVSKRNLTYQFPLTSVSGLQITKKQLALAKTIC